MNINNDNILSIGMVLIFFTWEDCVPMLKVIIGLVTAAWLLFQLFRGLEKRKEERQQHKITVQKYQIELRKLEREEKNETDTK